MTSDDNQYGRGLETQLATELDTLLRDLPVGGTLIVPASAEVCYSLELVLPQVLRARYPEWATESLDGIFVARATKTGKGSVEFVGTCILISDQTITPFLVELRLSPAADAISSIRLMLGEPGGGRLRISGPPCNSRDADRLLALLISRLDAVDWVYTVARVNDNGGD